MKKYLAILFCLPLLAACDDFFETDISKRSVDIIAPTDGAHVPSGDIAFRWHAVERATGYRFALVEPSFDSAARILADTLIAADSVARTYGCRLNMDAGEYEWSVEAFNTAYASRTTVLSLTVTDDEER